MKLTERVAEAIYQVHQLGLKDRIEIAKVALEEIHKAFKEQGIILCWPQEDF